MVVCRVAVAHFVLVAHFSGSLHVRMCGIGSFQYECGSHGIGRPYGMVVVAYMVVVVCMVVCIVVVAYMVVSGW